MEKQSLEDIIDNGVRQQTPLSLKTFRKILDDLVDNSLYDSAGIRTADDVATFFDAHVEGLTGSTKKKVFGACLDACGITHTKMSYTDLASNEGRKKLFFEIFAVEGAAAVPRPAAPEKAAEPAAPAAPVMQPAESVVIDWSRVAKDSKRKELPKAFDCTEYQLYDELPITAQDKKPFCIDQPPADLYTGGLALLRGKEVIAQGHFEKADGKLCVVCTQGIQYSKFRGMNKFTLLMLPQDALAQITDGAYGKASAYRHEVTIRFHELPVAENNRALCIDFGTSNTTAGSYVISEKGSKEPELVKFPSTKRNDDGSRVLMDMMPTLVYVRSCKDPKHIDYLFGYEAKDALERSFTPKGSLFPEIKRWIATMDTQVEITDEDDNTCKVKHRDIIQAYLTYVISCATQYFKCRFQKLHFSAPVKLKNHFVKQMQKMFGDTYQVYAPDKTLDEGIAIVYDHIRKSQRDEKYYGRENEMSVLILDCGGGTTDLAQCHFHFEHVQNDTGTDELHVRTRFENGDSNFGGNNITFRILQMLKIKIAAQVQEKPIPKIQEIISMTDDALMDQIDMRPIDAPKDIYAAFQKKYEEAEAAIPTKYESTEMKKEKERRRRNFYYLWYLAEKIKIEFYKTANMTNVVEMDFDNMEDVELKACIDDKTNYYLYRADAEKILDPLRSVHITIKEVERAICPDLYALLNKLLAGQGENRKKELVGSRHYELSGQSCKITMFHNLLKEFVPGQDIRRTHKKDDKTAQDRLKVSCVAGSIRYTADRGEGGITPKFEPEPPQLIYQVYRKKGDQKEEEASMSLEYEFDENGMYALDKKGQPIAHVKSLIYHYGPDADNAQFLVRYEWQFDGDEGAEPQYEDKRTVTYEFAHGKQGGRMLSNLDLDLEENYIHKLSYLRKSDADEIIANIEAAVEAGNHQVRLVFLVPDRSGYGFYIFQILKTWEKGGMISYKLEREPKLESFEDEELESFFNGKR